MSDKKPSDDSSQETKAKLVRKTLAKSKKIKNTNQMVKPVGGLMEEEGIHYYIRHQTPKPKASP